MKNTYEEVQILTEVKLNPSTGIFKNFVQNCKEARSLGCRQIHKVKFDYFMLIFRPLPKGHHQELLQDSKFIN